MPDPIIPDHYRAMWIMQHPSGLPEDRFVNTWFFRGDGIGTHPAVHDNIAAVLSAFYQGVTPAGNQIENFMPGSHLTVHELRTYYLGDTPPRPPIITEIQPQNPGAGNALPSEVAACLSFRTTQRGPRGRGRLYLGPLVSSVAQTTNGWTRPSVALMNAVADRAADVLNTTENVTWVGLSRAAQATYEVTGGYVDDAFDTQRRRGAPATTRTPFGDYVLAAPPAPV